MAFEALATTVPALSFIHHDFPVQCRSMTIAGVAFLIGCVWQVAAKRYVALLLVGRIFWGVGVGFADQSVTIYNAEMAPPQWRGLLHILFQLATVTGNDGYRTSCHNFQFVLANDEHSPSLNTLHNAELWIELMTAGILIAQVINIGTYNIRPWGWRLSLGLASVPGTILLLGGLFLPDSPNSLIERGQLEKGKQVLQRIRGTQQVEEEYGTILAAQEVRNAHFCPSQLRHQLIHLHVFSMVHEDQSADAVSAQHLRQ